MNSPKRSPKSTHFRRLLALTALLFGAGGLWAVVLSANIWTPGVGVRPSQANIIDLFGAEDDPQAGFQRALKHMGHEAPRAFDINGNTVYFSVNHIDKKPIELLKRYQDEFVHQKLNQKTYITLNQADTSQARQDMLTGGIVPSQISERYVAMGGGLTENNARTPDELFALEEDYRHGKIDKKFRAYRFIEAFQSPGARYSTVVASWSDDNFDYRKMRTNSQVKDQNVDPRIPACPGCTRLQRFADLDPAREHGDHIFIGAASVDKTRDFYQRSLKARGWKLDPASQILKKVHERDSSLPDARMLIYRRQGRTLELTVYPTSHDETISHLTLSKG